jgi:hypothetical protein
MYGEQAEVSRPTRVEDPIMEEQCLKEEYKPKRQELLREYSVNIRFLTIGCVIEVGCKSIPFTSVDEAMKELNEYVKNPYEMVKKWNEIFEQA